QPAPDSPPRRRRERDRTRARPRPPRQHLRYRRRRTGEHDRCRTPPGGIDGRAEALHGTRVAAASHRAVSGACDVDPPAALERESMRRAWLAAGVSDGARRVVPMTTDSFEAYRPRLFGVAYRMLGSASEAEDVVQDAWLRYAEANRDDVRSPEAFLTTIVTRLCLDRLKSARATREQYIGPWLPEPVLTNGRQHPEQSAALAESLTLAFMVLLETLAPEERAVLLLREVFEYPYADIATMLETSAANCRQLFHRAKARLADRRPRFERDPRQKREIVERFVTALMAGDAGALS